MNAIIVVPTIREQCLLDFLEAWEEQLRDHHVIVIEDHPERTFRVRKPYVTHYDWHDIDTDLGENGWIIPRTSAANKSYGIYKAWQQKPDMIVCLDDDCLPACDDFLEQHYSKLSKPVDMPAWMSTIGGIFPRGMPYYNASRKVDIVLSHGLWSGVPDYDAVTQLVAHRLDNKLSYQEMVFPHGLYFPMCIMNVAFKPEIAVLMYQLLLGERYKYARFDDMWAGVIAKRICDHLGYWMASGSPTVMHSRASNVWKNLKLEVGGLEVNEVFWEKVDQVELSATDPASCYSEVASQLDFQGEYWDELKLAMRTWTSLFAETER